MNYELRFLDSVGKPIAIRAVVSDTDEAAKAQVLSAHSPDIYERIEVWREGEKIYEGPRIVVKRKP